MNALPKHRASAWLQVGAAAYIATIFAIDFMTPPLVDVWVLYLPLLLLLTWLGAPRQIVCAAFVCTLLVTVDICLTQREIGAALILVILGTRLIALWLVAISGIVIVRSTHRRKELEGEVLEAAANEQQRIGQELHDSVGQELTAWG